MPVIDKKDPGNMGEPGPVELKARWYFKRTDRLDDPEDEWGRTFYGRLLEFRDQGIYADRMEEQKVSLRS
jgi:hypothetical protein